MQKLTLNSMSNAYKERNLEPVPHWRGKCILLIPFAKSLLFTNEIVIKLLWILVCDLRHTYCIAFLKDEKHIEHFLYLTMYSISIDYGTSVGFRNSRSEKAQGASLLIHSKPPDRTQGLVTILLFSYYIWPPLHYKIHKVFYSKGVVA